MNVLLKGVACSSHLLLTEQTFPRVPLLVWIYLQEILCSAPGNLQFQQVLVKPRNISSDRLQHPGGAQILK